MRPFTLGFTNSSSSTGVPFRSVHELWTSLNRVRYEMSEMVLFRRADVCIWARGSAWRRHTGKHGCSVPHQRITQSTSGPHVASPTWSSTEQVARPATKRFHASDWRALEASCRPWTWWCNDATALAGYATMMMTTIHSYSFICTTVDKTQLCHTAEIKWDGDITLTFFSVLSLF